MGQKMEAAFKMHPNGGDSNGVAGGGVAIHVGLKATGDSFAGPPHIKSSATTSLLTTLQRHRKNKIESSAGKQLKVAEEKREKRSSNSSFKTFFNKIGSRGMLLYGSRQEVVPTSPAIMANAPKQPLFNKNEKDPFTSPPMPVTLAKKPQIYHRHSLSSHSRSEFFTYIKCDDPTDGLSWDRKSPERGHEKNKPRVGEESHEEEDHREVKKGSSLKRSHFPYSFLRSKLGTLPEDDKHQLIPNESISPASHRDTLDVTRQNSITSLDCHHHPQQRNPQVRQLSTVQRLSRHLSSSNAESGYDSDSGRNVDSGGEKWSPGGTSCDDEPQQQDVTRRASRQLIIRRLSETEDVGIVTRLKLLPNSTDRQIPVVTGMMENGAAFRWVVWPVGVLFLILFIIVSFGGEIEI